MKTLNDYAQGEFLKATNITSESEIFVIIKVEEGKSQDGKKEILELTLEHNALKCRYGLNKVNLDFLIKSGYTEPIKLVGKKITFRKVLVTNPATKKEVDGIRINSISE